MTGIVSQTPQMFEGTIKYNICYGLEEGTKINEKDLHEVGKLANAHKFIMNKDYFPDGY